MNHFIKNKVMTMTSVLTRLQDFLKDESHPLKEIYTALPDVKEHTIRARLSENVGKCFKKISAGIYIATNGETQALIIAEDNLTGIKEIESNTIDFIIIDSNYPSLNGHLAVGTTRKKSGKWAFDTEEISQELLNEMFRVLKPSGHFYSFLPGDSISDYANTLEYNNKFIRMCQEAGFNFRKRLIWNKGRTMGYPYASAHEQIIFFIKGNKCISYDNTVTNVLSHPKLSNQHPLRAVNETAKPVELIMDLVKVCSKEGDIGLDLYGGSLTLADACLRLKRHCIIFEKSKQMILDAIKCRNFKVIEIDTRRNPIPA
jgi:site-specific DNA-methyltransferase (adenine-specific)